MKVSTTTVQNPPLSISTSLHCFSLRPEHSIQAENSILFWISTSSAAASTIEFYFDCQG